MIVTGGFSDIGAATARGAFGQYPDASAKCPTP